MSIQRYSRQLFRYYHSLKYQTILLNKPLVNVNQINLTRLTVKNYISNNRNHGISNIREVLQRIQRENRIKYNLINDNLSTSSLKQDLSDDEIITLLQYCSNCIPYYTKEARNKLCQSIYKKLLDENNTNLEIYHNYIRVCTDNLVKININEFLLNLLNIKCSPNGDTFKLLLNNLGETGDVNQIVSILNTMKDRDIALNEQDFNNIIQAHTIKGGLSDGETVLRTMKATFIAETNSTTLALLKGLALRDDINEFWMVYRRYQYEFKDDNLIEILEIVGLNGNLDFLKQILNEFNRRIALKDTILKIDMLCIHLINMRQPEAAMLIYQSLIDPVSDKKYGHFLLREMLICDVPIEVIIETSKNLRDTNLNCYSLENTAEIALRLRKFDIAWRFLKEFEYLRPHFFWPFIIDNYQKRGESGIFDVLQKMQEIDVKLDRETLHTYVIPNCSLDDPKLFIKKLQQYGCTVKDILPGVLLVLLENNQIDSVQNLCDSFNVQIYDDKLLKILPFAWYKSKNLQAIVTVLQKLRESDQKNDELVGNFLIRALKYCNKINDFKRFHQLIKEISARKLRLNTTATDILLQNINGSCPDKKLIRDLTNCMNDLEDLTMQIEQHQIIHPRDMNLEQLECHLIELKNKQMETRGILRKLIQQYCNIGNYQRMNELRDEFLKLNYKETPGMKSSIMFSLIKQNNLQLSLDYYRDLKINHPNFKLDHFKIIDFVTLLAKNRRFDEAKECLINESKNGKIGNQRGIERNCLELLTIFDDDHEQKQMFDLLLINGYCKPTNVILGPLIRLHLNKGEIEKASRLFINFANKYRCTPLQFELISAILDGNNPEILQQIVAVTAKIHGEMAANMAAIAAMAQKGLETSLIKYLSTIPPISSGELLKRCNRWIEENQIEPLLVLERALRKIRYRYDVDIILVSIMKLYGVRNDCESALAFYQQLCTNERLINPKLERELINLLNRCKFEIPEPIKSRLFNK